MTQTEAEQLAKRLSRVWVPDMELKLTRDTEGNFDFVSPHWRQGVEFEYFYSQRSERLGYTFQISRKTDHRWTGRIWCHIASGNIDANVAAMHAHKTDLRASYAQFAQEWLLLFRRNCWLSGTPIEASAHEKAEWQTWAKEHGLEENDIPKW